MQVRQYMKQPLTDIHYPVKGFRSGEYGTIKIGRGVDFHVQFGDVFGSSLVACDFRSKRSACAFVTRCF